MYLRALALKKKENRISQGETRFVYKNHMMAFVT